MSLLTLATTTALTADEKAKAVEEYINHHMSNGQVWHLPFLPPIHFPAPFSVHAAMLVLGMLLALAVFVFLVRKRAEQAPHGLTNALEALLLYIRDEVCVPALGAKDGRRMAPLFCSFFFFILCLNLMGLVPLFLTATANVNVTAGLASFTFLFMVVGGLVLHGPFGFFRALLPHGVPWILLPFLLVLELVGIAIKTFALTMRLVANMMAGHFVIFSMIGLLVTYGAWALPALALAVGIYFLELLVAVLQAYVFTMLSALFIGQIYHPAH